MIVIRHVPFCTCNPTKMCAYARVSSRLLLCSLAFVYRVFFTLRLNYWSNFYNCECNDVINEKKNQKNPTRFCYLAINGWHTMFFCCLIFVLFSNGHEKSRKTKQNKTKHSHCLWSLTHLSRLLLCIWLVFLPCFCMIVSSVDHTTLKEINKNLTQAGAIC